MPELPEVETIRRGLLKYLPGRKIAGIEIKCPKLLINCSAADLERSLSGQSYADLDRLGKILIIKCERHSLLVRLGMTGQLTFRDPELPDHNEFKIHPVTGLQRNESQYSPDKHTHIIIAHEDGTSLCYRDIRKFGRWYLYANGDLDASPELKSLGPDPFRCDYTLENLREALRRTSRAVKTALLDQSIICGLGNIYADEVLFAAKIQPLRPADSLSDEELERIYSAVKPILQSSIDNRGTTFSDYRDADGNKGENVSSLKVYGRGGKNCLHCGETLNKASVGGRTSTWCPKCQH
ncbi:bifunctional DNA-formamidopyrimidine glycosylase/DNA-(apurinic or apyrimidinic site) lyase [bacterium]|nr:bifunctional DNA-formamidopyrimidine glycosylase/DNA-(apurinic or apyrimidinic site) lyase [bacterium]